MLHNRVDVSARNEEGDRCALALFCLQAGDLLFRDAIGLAEDVNLKTPAISAREFGVGC